MEYRLREYLTVQLSKQPIDPLDISCRTTFCRIQTSGRTNDSESAFHKAAQDASKELLGWANLWYAEVEGQAENGEWDGSVTIAETHVNEKAARDRDRRIGVCCRVARRRPDRRGESLRAAADAAEEQKRHAACKELLAGKEAAEEIDRAAEAKDPA